MPKTFKRKILPPRKARSFTGSNNPIPTATSGGIKETAIPMPVSAEPTFGRTNP